MKCTLCGAENPPSARNCHVCNFKLRTSIPQAREDFRRRSEFYPSGKSSSHRFLSKTPIYAGGVLLLVALFDFMGILVASIIVGNLRPELGEAMMASGLLVGFFASLTTLGGFLAIFRTRWKACIALALLTTIMHVLYGSLISLLMSACATVFIYLSKQEFE